MDITCRDLCEVLARVELSHAPHGGGRVELDFGMAFALTDELGWAFVDAGGHIAAVSTLHQARQIALTVKALGRLIDHLALEFVPPDEPDVPF